MSKLPYPTGFTAFSPKQANGAWWVQCQVCHKGACKLEHVAGYDYRIAQQPCTRSCPPEACRARLRLAMGLTTAHPGDVLPAAHEHLTSLLAAFTQLAEMLPQQFRDEAIPIIRDGSRAARGLADELGEMARRFATIPPPAM